MGESLHRGGFIRRATSLLANYRLFLASMGSIAFLATAGFFVFVRQPEISKSVKPEATDVLPLELVAALGQLEPAGDVRRLAAPVSGFGGTPRVLELNVQEGDEVKKGQILAVFDSRPKILADIEVVKALAETIQVEIVMKEIEVSRYKEAATQGATSIVLLEEKQIQLASLKGKLKQALAELLVLDADLKDSQLKTPIDGVVLRVHTQVGERPTNEGILEVGANKYMEALIEVYESDINRISLGQEVILISENGGFEGDLIGQVTRISPQVRQRKVLSTDPTGDADARVVEVLVKLDKLSAMKVSHLTGMKVIARFQKL